MNEDGGRLTRLRIGPRVLCIVTAYTIIQAGRELNPQCANHATQESNLPPILPACLPVTHRSRLDDGPRLSEVSCHCPPGMTVLLQVISGLEPATFPTKPRQLSQNRTGTIFDGGRLLVRLWRALQPRQESNLGSIRVIPTFLHVPVHGAHRNCAFTIIEAVWDYYSPAGLLERFPPAVACTDFHAAASMMVLAFNVARADGPLGTC